MRKTIFEDKELQRRYEKETEELINKYGSGCSSVIIGVSYFENDIGEDLWYSLRFVKPGSQPKYLEISDNVTLVYRDRYDFLSLDEMSEKVELNG